LLDNLAEWPLVVDFARRHRAEAPGAALIAGDFMLCAQLEFAFGEPIAVLPHPRNARHGRAGQLAILGRDIAALDRRGWSHGLLLVEDTARRETDRLPALLELCRNFGAVEWRDELVLHGGRFRVLAFDVARREGPSAEAAGDCDLPPLGDFDASTPAGVRLGRPFAVEGWAIDEFEGIAAVEVRLGEVLLGRVRPDRDHPGVRGQWPTSTDPAHPRVGFRIEADPGTLGVRPGRQQLTLRAIERTGRARLVAVRSVAVAKR
jgi:hypothetical protein